MELSLRVKQKPHRWTLAGAFNASILVLKDLRTHPFGSGAHSPVLVLRLSLLFWTSAAPEVSTWLYAYGLWLAVES